MSEQRIQTIKIVWKGDDAKNKAVEFTRTIKGTDASVEQLSASLGKNATVTAKTELSQREYNAQMRKATTEAIRLENNYNKMTAQLTQQAAMLKMTDQEQEIYTAQMRLGANATEEQRNEIARLITQLNLQAGASGKATTANRKLRGVAQNLGWQLQDVAVQAQMGTNGLVIFGQQGSQILSSFGAWGAMAGAVVAVVASIASVAQKSGEAAKAQELLKETVFDTTKYIREQTAANKELTESQIELIKLNDSVKLKEYQKQLATVTARIEYLNKNAMSSNIDKMKAQNKELTTLRATYDSLEQKIWDLEDATESYNESGNDKDRKSDVLRDFESEYDRLVKATETIQQEYNRRAKIVEAYVKEVGYENTAASTAYKLLEQWKTAELKKESDKRLEIERKAIQDEAKRREKVLSTVAKNISRGAYVDPVVAETKRNNDTLKALYEERNALGLSDYAKRQEINALIEAETDRHTVATTEALLEQTATRVQAVSSVVTMMSSTVDLLSNGVEEVRNTVSEMNGFQKAMFFATQSIAATEAVINGISLGMKLAALYPTAAPAMITTGASLGAASAGAIMGTTFAGMFDNGGVIPSGQAGIVAENYDELVGGTMVYNNSGSGLNVTGSKDTASMMGGTKLNVSVVNNAPGVDHQVQQIDENTVKIIATKVLADNIDKSVSGVINKKGTQTDKAMRASYTTNRKYN